VPVVASNRRAEVTVAVDRVLERARDLATSSGIPHAVADYKDVIGLADAAIVALPHHLYAQVSEDLLKAGVRVLVEKPMALTTAECDRMIAAAEDGGAALAVGLARRFQSSGRYAKELIDSGLLGEIESFDFSEGAPYSWPVASDFMFRRDAGGGVLFDTGSHTLDLLLWWLGEPETVEYSDDDQGEPKPIVSYALR
jgi:predicted dehydrogenase